MQKLSYYTAVFLYVVTMTFTLVLPSISYGQPERILENSFLLLPLLLLAHRFIRVWPWPEKIMTNEYIASFSWFQILGFVLLSLGHIIAIPTILFILVSLVGGGEKGLPLGLGIGFAMYPYMYGLLIVQTGLINQENVDKEHPPGYSFYTLGIFMIFWGATSLAGAFSHLSGLSEPMPWDSELYVVRLVSLISALAIIVAGLGLTKSQRWAHYLAALALCVAISPTLKHIFKPEPFISWLSIVMVLLIPATLLFILLRSSLHKSKPKPQANFAA
jgi:hypothetical protein